MYLYSALPTTQFRGYCRYNFTTGKESWGRIKFGITARSADDCYHKCKSYGGEKKAQARCAAFSFETKDTENCDLYKEGPYTYGNDHSNTTCYNMPTGKLIFTVTINMW